MNYGVSFSIKQCRNFGVDPAKCLDWLIKTGGFKRFRLMSYWNELEKQPGDYDFSELDRQIKQIKKAKGTISLCLGVRQPRWPENHWPDWAWELPKGQKDKALLNFVETVVKRYKDETVITSYQLENEALLEVFGERSEVDRDRLKAEYKLVKSLDPDKPIVMTTSTSWGIPVKGPIPDMIGFSYYQVHFNPTKLAYTTAFHTPILQRVKAGLIKGLWRRPSFIHELQLEPWGPKNIWEMSFDDQKISMDISQVKQNLKLARKTKLQPIDLWGGEWWYWCSTQKDKQQFASDIIQAITESSNAK